MKIVLTGGAGHITKHAVEQLLNNGHNVTVISRNAENLASITAKGAKAAIGDLSDQNFLTDTFKDADAVYLMIPPNFSPKGTFREYQNNVADAFVQSVSASGVKNIVVLSSIGAHLGNGTGPVDGLYDLEKKLSVLKDLNIRFLRPSYFMYNLMGQIPMIKNIGMMGGNFFGESDEKLVLTHTNDIAKEVAASLSDQQLSGHTIQYIAGDERKPSEIAEVIGKAIGKDLKWVTFTDEQTLGGMLQAGLPEFAAKMYTEMGACIRNGKMQEDYWKNIPKKSSIKLEDYLPELVAAYNH